MDDAIRKEAYIEWKFDGYDSVLSIMVGKSVFKITSSEEVIRNSLVGMGIIHNDIGQIKIDIVKLPLCPDYPPPELGPGED